MRSILGLDEDGEDHPLTVYDIGCDEGAWNAFLRKLWCGAQAMPFALGKWSVGVATDLMGWALDFRIAQAVAPVATALSQVYNASLVGPLGLRHLAWTLAALAAGWHLLRARAARAIGQMAATFAVAAIGAILLANPGGYLDGSITLMRNSSGAVLEAVSDSLGGQADAPASIRSYLSRTLRRAFVAEPYDLINWGEPLSGRCAAARDQILAGGPWGSEDWPREIMREHGCDEAADYNANPTDERASASLIVAMAAIGASVLLVLVVLVLLVAQLTVLAMFAGASIVWTVALAPGAARDLLGWWLSRLAWAIGITVGATFVLSWLTVTVTAVLSATSDISIIQRCLLVLLVVAFAFRLRSHIGRFVEQAANRARQRAAQPAGHHRWAGPATAGALGVSALGLRATARSWALDMPGGQYLYTRAYARHFRGHRRGGPIRTTRRALGRARTSARRAGRISGEATNDIVRGARAAVGAPAQARRAARNARGQATAASQRARLRLQQARTRGQRAAQHGPVGSWWRVPGGRHEQQTLDIGSPRAYRQLQFDLDDRPRPQSLPVRRGPETYEQQALDTSTAVSYHQPELAFDDPRRRQRGSRPPSPSYEQQSFDMGDLRAYRQLQLDLRERPPRPRPAAGDPESYEQQRFDIGNPRSYRQLSFDDPPAGEPSDGT